MRPSTVRRTGVGAWLVLGFLGQGHAGPTRLDELPAAARNDSGLADLPPPDAPPRAAADTAGGNARRATFPLDPPDGTLRGHRADPADPTADTGVMPIDLRADRGAGLAPAAADQGGHAIKEFAQAALGWVHDTLPWTSGKDARGALPAAPVPAENLVLPVEMDATASRVFAPHAARPTAAAIDPRNVTFAMPAAETPASRHGIDVEADGPLHRAIRFGRTLIAHPLTWLAIVLAGAAHILVSRFRRRGK